MTKNFKLLMIALPVLAILTIYGCKKDYDKPTLSTAEVTEVTYTSAVSGGNITDNGGAPIIARGICWSTTAKPTTSNSHSVDGTGSGSFVGSMEDLTPGTTYYVRAYATNRQGTGYGNEFNFTTSALALATVTTAEVTTITSSTATTGGDVISTGGSDITARGVVWSTVENPTLADNNVTSGTGKGAFVSNINDLAPATTYYLRAFATNITGTSYGNQVTFSTAAAVPVVTTTEVTAITNSSAATGGNITSNGGSTVTVRGVAWGTAENPTVEGSKTSDGEGSGIFTSNLADLTPGTTYYVRAYATNAAGTGYGNQVSFTTSPVAVPTLTTSEIINITSTSAASGGNITNNGGAPVTVRGVVWNTSENPTVDGSKTTNGEGSGIFASSLTDLNPGTTYYVRAYATNSAGTAYGNQLSFTTTAIAAPTLSTTEISSLTPTTAVSGGTIASTGGSAITANGVAWGTSENPTTSDNVTTDATGSSTFTSNLAGLSPGTVYYVRAYATNGAGTSYGNQISFITPVADIEGNIYRTVAIGSQIWMAENLKTVKYNDNTDIPNVTSNAEWIALTTPAYSWYNNNAANKGPYGAIYNWFAVNTGKLCPTGWHVPTDTEFNNLEVQLGLPASDIHIVHYRGTDQGTQLKSTTTWDAGGNGTNTSGFTAVAAGYRQWTTGSFWGAGTYTYFWTATDDNANGHPEVAWYRRLDNVDPRVYKATTVKIGGKYIRCLKD